MKARTRRPLSWTAAALLIGSACIFGDAGSVAAESKLPFLSRDVPSARLGCAWPFIVTAQTLNLAYPDPNATYWAMPFELAEGESLLLRGTYPSARFMAVTIYDATGDILQQLSDFQIPPAPGSANPYAEADPPPGSGRRFTLRVVTAASGESGPDVLALGPGQRAGWIVYRVYLGNPKGDAAGGAPLPTIVRERRGVPVRLSRPCTRFLPGTAIAAILSASMPDPIVVSESPSMVRIQNDFGLFVNAANAYLSAFADAGPGRILVLRGKLPTFPDTGAGQSVVGPYDLRYLSIASNLNVKPYPVVDGVYDAELPLDAQGYYTVAVARDGEIPPGEPSAEGVTVLRWGHGPNETVIVRNMLPSASFPNAVQDVAPSVYGAPSDAAAVMGQFYPVIVECSVTAFDAGGPRGCFAEAGTAYPGDQ